MKKEMKMKKYRFTVVLRYPNYLCPEGAVVLYTSLVTANDKSVEDRIETASDKARKECIKSLADGSGIDYDETDFDVLFVYKGWVHSLV